VIEEGDLVILAGVSSAFVLNDMKYERQVGSQFPLFMVKPPRSRSKQIFSTLMRIVPKKHGTTPLYVGISGLDYQVVRDGLVTQENIEYILTRYEGVVKSFKPDVLIGDTNLLVWMLSSKVALPMVQVVRYASHPKTGKLIWWKNETDGMNPPSPGLLFNPILNRLGLNPIEKAEHLLRGDLYIVPSIPEIEPIPQDDKTIHVGQLSVSEINEEVPVWLEDINDDNPLIYMTIGGGAGPVGNKLCFQTAINAFANKPIEVVISTSAKCSELDFPCLPKNIRIFQWVPGRLLISRADLIIFHGGYGTMMECLAYGKPSITIPFQTEQEGNGRRLEQLGCGRVVKLSREDYKQIRSKWRYGTYSFLVQNRYDLNPDELIGKVNEVLFSNEYLNNAQRLQSKIKEYHGAGKAMELIEKYSS